MCESSKVGKGVMPAKGDTMKMKSLIASAILSIPFFSTAQEAIDAGLKGKLDVLCIGPLMGIQDNYTNKKKPTTWNFLEAEKHVRVIMGGGYPQLVDLLTPVVLRTVNNAVHAVRDEKNRRHLTAKLVILSNMCVKDLQEQVKAVTPTK